MKHMLILAIALPLVAYLPFAFGNYVPVWLNVTLFISALFAAIVSVLWWTYKSKATRPAAKIMRAIGTLLYFIIVVGLVDVALLTLGVPSVVIVGGEGWGDLIAFISWAVFIIPASYIIGTTLLFVAKHIDRPKRA
jgi:hypothetical protein